MTTPFYVPPSELEKAQAVVRSMLATLDAIHAHTTDEWARNMARRGIQDADAKPTKTEE